MSANQKRVGKAPPQESYSGSHYRSWGTGEFNPLGTVRGERVHEEAQWIASNPKVRALHNAIKRHGTTVSKWKNYHGLNEDEVRYDVRKYMDGTKKFEQLNEDAQRALEIAALYVGITSL